MGLVPRTSNCRLFQSHDYGTRRQSRPSNQAHDRAATPKSRHCSLKRYLLVVKRVSPNYLQNINKGGPPDNEGLIRRAAFDLLAPWREDRCNARTAVAGYSIARIRKINMKFMNSSFQDGRAVWREECPDAPEVGQETVIYCNQCAWHGRSGELS